MVIQVQETYRELPGVQSGQVNNPLNGVTPTEIAGRQAAQMGQGLKAAGGELAKIVQEEQAKANKARLNDAYNQAITAAHALRYDKDQGYTKFKGADAVKGVQGEDGGYRPITESYGEKLDKRLAEIRKNLGNDDVSAQFDMVAGDVRTKFRNEAITYEAEQGSVYAAQVNDQTIVAEGNLLAADPFGPTSALSVTRIRDAANTKARQAGMDAEGIAVVEKETLGKVHSAVITSMLDAKNSTGAKAYFEIHKGDMPGLDAANIKAKLDVALAGAEAIGAVDEVLRAIPLIQNQPANRSEMDAALRAKFADDPEKLKAARAELSQRVSDHEFQETETNAGNVDAVWKLRNSGRSLASVASSSAWLALPGAIQGQLREAWDKQDSDPDRLSSEAWGSWLQLMLDPQAMLNMTPVQIAALEPKFGRTLVGQLANRANSVQAEAAGKQVAATLASPKIDTDLFMAIAAEYKLPAYTQNMKPEDVQTLATARFLLEDAVAKQQQATGKVIPPADMPSFLRKTAARIPVALAAKSMRMLGVSPALPAGGTLDSARIAAYLAEKNLPPTIENQRRAYLDILEAGSLLVDE